MSFQAHMIPRRTKDPENMLLFFRSLKFSKLYEKWPFQVRMPNSPLLLNYLCFGTRFLQESRLTVEVLILAFWLGVCCCHSNRAGEKQGLNGFCSF